MKETRNIFGCLAVALLAFVLVAVLVVFAGVIPATAATINQTWDSTPAVPPGPANQLVILADSNSGFTFTGPLTSFSNDWTSTLVNPWEVVASGTTTSSVFTFNLNLDLETPNYGYLQFSYLSGGSLSGGAPNPEVFAYNVPGNGSQVEGAWTWPATAPVGANFGAVPEPASMSLIGGGLIGLSLVARRRRASTNK